MKLFSIALGACLAASAAQANMMDFYPQDSAQFSLMYSTLKDAMKGVGIPSVHQCSNTGCFNGMEIKTNTTDLLLLEGDDGDDSRIIAFQDIAINRMRVWYDNGNIHDERWAPNTGWAYSGEVAKAFGYR